MALLTDTSTAYFSGKHRANKSNFINDRQVRTRSNYGNSFYVILLLYIVLTGGESRRKEESAGQPELKTNKDSCVNSKGESKNVSEPHKINVASGGSRKRSPNTRTPSSETPDLGRSKRHLGSSTTQNTKTGENTSEKCHSSGESTGNAEVNEETSKNMETDACATETGTASSASSSNSSSGYSSTRSNNSKPPHLSRGTSKSAEGASSGKENRVPSLMSSHSNARGGDASPVPIIKNRPQRSFVGYVSPYEQFLRFTETDPKYRSEKSQGKILGLYKFCGEIGSGNFSKVKLGIHQLTKGLFVSHFLHFTFHDFVNGHFTAAYAFIFSNISIILLL